MHPMFRAILSACLLCWACFPAAAQTGAGQAAAYPDRPIKLVVPFPPGGPTDYTARLYAEKMSQDLGQPIVIENRPGGNSAIGAQQVARSAPDGYTLLFAMDVTMVMNPITTANLSYKPLEDFAPVSITSYNTSLLVVRADGPKTVQELIAQAKANPGKLNYGAGIITTRLAGYLFNQLAGIDAVFIPYKGSAEVVQAMLNGSIQYAVDGVSAHYPLIQSGKERALAKLNKRPLASLPELKPLDEVANLPELGEISTWGGIVAPRGTPPAIVAKLQQSIAKVSKQDDIREKLLKFGIVAASNTPEEFRVYIQSETDKWSKVVKDSGLTLN